MHPHYDFSQISPPPPKQKLKPLLATDSSVNEMKCLKKKQKQKTKTKTSQIKVHVSLSWKFFKTSRYDQMQFAFPNALHRVPKGGGRGGRSSGILIFFPSSPEPHRVFAWSPNIILL